MLKFLLVHCYTDYNKGDAGIIISTIQQLRNNYPGCTIWLQSTYSCDDENFYTQHKELEKYADKIFGCVFPQLFLRNGDTCKYDSRSKTIALIKYAVKNLFNTLSFKVLGKMFFLKKWEEESIQSIKDADVIISKGGSYICSNGTLRDDLGLARILHPFYLAKLFGKKAIVLGQSIGPFDSKFSQRIYSYYEKFIDKLYVREFDSFDLLKSYGFEVSDDKYKFCPDIAFSLDSSQGKIIVERDNDAINVGVTIVNFDFDHPSEKSSYIESIRYLFDNLSTNFNAKFFVFPQVIDEHPEFGNADIKLAKEIVAGCKNPNSICVIEGNFESIDLANTYKNMDVFVATRLHSSIFATANNVPAINIAYHGTKSEGTFKLLNCGDLVIRISKVDKYALYDKVVYIIKERDEIKKTLLVSVAEINRVITDSIKTL